MKKLGDIFLVEWDTVFLRAEVSTWRHTIETRYQAFESGETPRKLLMALCYDEVDAFAIANELERSKK